MDHSIIKRLQTHVICLICDNILKTIQYIQISTLDMSDLKDDFSCFKSF